MGKYPESLSLKGNNLSIITSALSMYIGERRDAIERLTNRINCKKGDDLDKTLFLPAAKEQFVDAVKLFCEVMGEDYKKYLTPSILKQYNKFKQQKNKLK